LASTVGVKNPYRYRGYRYDTETGLYYLQSRYYDPGAKRFVNADGYVSTGQGVLGNNMFAYCGNNPVNCIDPIGTYKIPMLQNVLHDCSKPIIYKENIMEKWAKEGVIYESNGSGKGGKIINSYKITDFAELYSYAYYLVMKSEYSDDFLGSVEGVVFEWEVHNFIYYFGPEVWNDNATDVEFGATIFDDPHEGLNFIMWEAFRWLCPIQHFLDLLIYLDSNNNVI